MEVKVESASMPVPLGNGARVFGGTLTTNQPYVRDRHANPKGNQKPLGVVFLITKILDLKLARGARKFLKTDS